MTLIPATTLHNYLSIAESPMGGSYFKIPCTYQPGNESVLRYIQITPQEAIAATHAYLQYGTIAPRHAQIIGLFAAIAFMKLRPETAHKFHSLDSWKSAELDKRHTEDGYSMICNLCCEITEALTGVNPALNVLFSAKFVQQ